MEKFSSTPLHYHFAAEAVALAQLIALDGFSSSAVTMRFRLVRKTQLLPRPFKTECAQLPSAACYPRCDPARQERLSSA